MLSVQKNQTPRLAFSIPNKHNVRDCRAPTLNHMEVPMNNTLNPVDLTDAELDAVSGAGFYYKNVTTGSNWNGGNVLSNNLSGNAVAVGGSATGGDVGNVIQNSSSS